MTWLVACVAAVAVFLLSVPARQATLAVSLEPYLDPPEDDHITHRWSLSIPAGGWAAAIGGTFTGLLVAQGDLFVAGRSRSSAALAILGASGGWVLWSMRETNRKERRARRLRFELPVVSDALALHVVAGESVVTALRSIVAETDGVATDEFRGVLGNHEAGAGLPEALAGAARATAHPDASRLYETLSHAHTTGARLAETLGDLAVDYRAALERDLTSEGGKRAIVTYGPVLALMVPTALIFLIYPTLLGLRTLSGAP